METDQVLWHCVPGHSHTQRKFYGHVFHLWELINSILWLKAKWGAFYFFLLQIEKVLMNSASVWYIFIIHLKLFRVWRSSAFMSSLAFPCCLTNSPQERKSCLTCWSSGGALCRVLFPLTWGWACSERAGVLYLDDTISLAGKALSTYGEFKFFLCSLWSEDRIRLSILGLRRLGVSNSINCML